MRMKGVYHSYLMSTQYVKVEGHDCDTFSSLVEDTLNIDNWVDEDRQYRSS